MSAAPIERSGIVLDLDQVTFRRADKEILHGISFTARAGEHWALLGPNGAGKSTILGFCGAVTHPTTGTVDVLGHRLGRVELQSLRRQIGHVNPRHPLRSPLTIRDVVLTGFTGSIERPLRWQPTIEQLETVDKLLFTLGLGPLADEVWPTLSQGERGRTLIARALINSPRLLLLDEPSTGLDVAAREQLLETIDTLDVLAPTMTWVLVTHHLEELPVTTTHAILVSAGAVVAAGPVDEVITTANVSAAFEHDITVSRDDGRWSARAHRRPTSP